MIVVATAAKPVGIIAKTSRRVAVALTISIGVGFLILTPWKNHAAASTSSLFLRTIILGLSGTTAFALFEVWPRKLPRWLQRWALQVVGVGIFMPVTTMLIYILSTPRGAPPFWAERSPLERMVAPDVCRPPGRAVDGARGDRPAEGSLRPRSEARVRARAQ